VGDRVTDFLCAFFFLLIFFPGYVPYGLFFPLPCFSPRFGVLSYIVIISFPFSFFFFVFPFLICTFLWLMSSDFFVFRLFLCLFLSLLIGQQCFVVANLFSHFRCFLLFLSFDSLQSFITCFFLSLSLPNRPILQVAIDDRSFFFPPPTPSPPARRR